MKKEIRMTYLRAEVYQRRCCWGYMKWVYVAEFQYENGVTTESLEQASRYFNECVVGRLLRSRKGVRVRIWKRYDDRTHDNKILTLTKLRNGPLTIREEAPSSMWY